MLPCSPGAVQNAEEVNAVAREVGFVVIIKPSAEGGMGMMVAEDPAAVTRGYETLVKISERLIGDDGVVVERYLPCARHVEMQIHGLADGRVIALDDRDCSARGRNPKLLEEAPASGLANDRRAGLLAAAVRAAGPRPTAARGLSNCWSPRAPASSTSS